MPLSKVYKGVKGLMSRLKTEKPKKMKKKKGAPRFGHGTLTRKGEVPVSIGHGMRSMTKIYDKYKNLED
jgi:hypothetical protein